MRILIIKPSSLGDIIHSLPVAVMLKKLYNNSNIHWLVFDRFAEILEDNPYIDNLIIWRKKNVSVSSFIDVVRKVRKEKFDMVIDLQGLARTTLLTVLSTAKETLGCPGMRELGWFFVKEVKKFDPNQHAVDRNLEVINYIKKVENKNDIIFPIILKGEHEDFAKKFLSKNGFDFSSKLIGILPSAGIKQKRWNTEKFSMLSERLLTELNANVIFFGSENDCTTVENIIGDGGNSKKFPRPSILNACSKTSLKQMSALMKYCCLIIGNDTGPLHIASALNIPCIGLYGPSNPKQLSPYNKNSIVFYKSLDCSPCGINTKCQNNKCMTDITVDEVFVSAEQIVKSEE